MINFVVGSTKIIDGETFILVQKSVKGDAVFGPYINIDAGEYIVEFGLRDADPSNNSRDSTVAVVDVACDVGTTILSTREIRGDELKKSAVSLFQLPFRLTERKALEFRVRATGACDLAIRLRRRLIDTLQTNEVMDFPPVSEPALGNSADVGTHSKRPVRKKGRPCFSPFVALDQSIIEADGRVPMFWATSDRETPFSNFGDALSPVVVAALSGLDSRITSGNRPNMRLVTAGSVMNDQRQGYAHVWGTGLVGPAYHFVSQPNSQGYKKPAELRLRIHAVRGALTRKSLLAAGIECPAIFGDPGWLLPKIIPPATEKTHELGIIPHITEFETQSPDSRVLAQFKRYDIGSESGVKIISTRHPPTWEGFVEKIREITACKRIISTSFHGLIVPQAYGIPTINFFVHGNDGLSNGDVRDDASRIDLRVRDFMLGAGYTSLPLYGRYREERTDWDDVIKAIDSVWNPLVVDTAAFLEALPLTLLPPAKRWKIPDQRAAQIHF